ncbi:SIR2 family protein [Methylorubrum sp. SB2]|uniref:SIR2 family protein n=1 Tax=Methylorubrum subtropicum TaxID=3138812 RepID=UPI00313E38E6
MPTATEITVLETVAKLDAEFAPMASAVANGEFALWVGSGISRQAPNLGDLIARAIEFIREKAVDPATQSVFEPALVEALTIGRADVAAARAHFGTPFAAWPMRDAVVNELWGNYSRLLDVRIPGEHEDYMLWEAIDVRAAFASPNPPAATHMAIAVLILEGAVHEIASANWDGFIEAAVSRLSGGDTDLLQVVVDPNHLRGAAAKARLLKFHGCILYATQDPGLYREFLTGSETQIIGWPDNDRFASVRAAVTAMATNFKTLMLGLSLQDGNLKGLFSAARRTNPWPWPCVPDAPGHVFCEDALQPGQKTMLKTVYAGSYNDHIVDIERSAHLRAWAEQVLLALVLRLIGDKLAVLVKVRLEATPLSASSGVLADALTSLRDLVAGLAEGDRTAFANRAIAVWSRALCLFRNGSLQRDPAAYEVLSASRPKQLAADENAKATGLAQFAIAMALLERGRRDGRWTLSDPVSLDLDSGALTATGAWTGATGRPVFLVRSAGIAIALEKAGAFANDNTVVIHADGAWQDLAGALSGGARSPSRPPGRSGAAQTLHVSIDRLVETAPDGVALQDHFVREVAL